MPEVARVLDTLTQAGHTPHPSTYTFTPAGVGSTKVFADGSGVMRSDDPWGVHVLGPNDPPNSTHPVFSGPGSTKVFADGIAVMRKLDPLNSAIGGAEGSTPCPSTILTGSTKVFAG